MAFPEFENGGGKILFFSRGKGRGHAIPDMEIARELKELSPDVQVRFVSYGTGASTLGEYGLPHIDMGLPDRNGINETMVLAGKLIGWLEPDLVVAHEEFAVLPVAKIFDKPTVLITDWFTDPERYTMTTLAFADRIVFLDEPGHFEEPESASGKVQYVGPVIRKFRYSRDDRERAREELRVPENALVLAVLPGSWREQELPILDLVLNAFDLLENDPKHMIWMAGEDCALIQGRTASRENVIVQGYDPEIDRVMVAADVAITKSTRKTLFELSLLGVPSISISSGLNPVDDLRAARFSGNLAASMDITAADLAAAVIRASRRILVAGKGAAGVHRCARLILDSVPGNVAVEG